MFDKRCRAGVERSLRPVGSGLAKARITADQLTALGLVLGAAAVVRYNALTSDDPRRYGRAAQVRVRAVADLAGTPALAAHAH